MSIRTSAILAIALALPASGCDMYQKSAFSTRATYRIPDSTFEITLDRQASHLFLAEYERTIVVLDNGTEILRQKAADDTGGYSRMNLYKIGPQKYYLAGDVSFDRFILDLETRSIGEAQATGSREEKEFLGAFDKDDRGTWRFIPMKERPEQKSKI